MMVLLLLLLLPRQLEEFSACRRLLLLLLLLPLLMQWRPRGCSLEAFSQEDIQDDGQGLEVTVEAFTLLS